MKRLGGVSELGAFVVDFAAAAPDVSPVVPSPDWLDEPTPALGSASPFTPDPAPPSHHPNFGRRFFQALVVFFCLFLLIRTIALEPFGVPTGSMAASLTGNHRTADCSRCGYPVRVGEPGPDARPVNFAKCVCPNCGKSLDLTDAAETPGDRLLVDKTVYHARAPRRWEIAVFHCPADLTKPYVKRVVGLPGEVIQVSGGDVYANGELLRKTLAQFREVRIPFFDLNYPPPGGWHDRWLIDPPTPKPTAFGPTPKPVDAAILHDDALHLAATAEPVWLTYRHWNLDTKTEEPVGDVLAYNGRPMENQEKFASRPKKGFDLEERPDPVHDFAVEFDLEVVAGNGSVALWLGDSADTVRADLPIAIPSNVQISHTGGPRMIVADDLRLKPGKTYRVEFAFVDRRASLALDGKEVVAPLDLPFDPPARPQRGGKPRPFQMAASNVTVVVRNLRLYRDIHYRTVGKADRGWPLPANEYFVLGDNSANSHDSRYWTINGQSSPGVPESDFIGKPFLIHQPLRQGRVTINGRDRTFRTLDWQRVRWLR